MKILFEMMKHDNIVALIGNHKERPLSECSIYDLVLDRPDYSKPCYDDKIVVCGHTPTQLITGNKKPGLIFKDNNYINLDCGASMGGKLAALCLETRQECYAG